ncbi:hypothetical protein Ancab_010144 [Ancistrocladus abbreviatus]
MVLDPDMELQWAMPSPMLLVFKPKHLWSVNGLGIGFGSIGLGYSIDDSGIGFSMIYGSIQAGNIDLNPEAMDTYPTIFAAGGTRYQSNNDEFGHEQREARYFGSMGEDARLLGSQIGSGAIHRARVSPPREGDLSFKER